MKERKNNLMSLEQFRDKHYGKPGTKKREDLEEGYEELNLAQCFWKHALKKD